MIEIKLDGPIPSKKNQRINTREGKSFPSREFEAWQNYALVEVRRQTRKRFLVPVEIEVVCIFGRKTVCDLDNRLSSILDMLHEALVIRDDRWEYVPKVSVEAEYRKGAINGAIIRIYEVAPVG